MSSEMHLEFQGFWESHIVSYYSSMQGTLAEAIEYALNGKGKFIRPQLCIKTFESILGEENFARLNSKKIRSIYWAASAVELIHNYSLVHDDLPCMDDDSLRRGRPTVHTIYGDAQALLVGDALLSDAFLFLSKAYRECGMKAQCVDALDYMSLAIGSSGMVLGQSFDMEETGASQSKDVGFLKNIHLLKTGKLLSLSMYLGAHLAGEPDTQVHRWSKIGESIGVAFQFRDDLIDAENNTGKSIDKDRFQNKLGSKNQDFLRQQERFFRDQSLNRIQDLLGSRSSLLDFVTNFLSRPVG